MEISARLFTVGGGRGRAILAIARVITERRRTAAAYRARARNKGIGMLWECAAGVPDEWVGNARRLGQVLDHLLDNGAKFTEHGRVTLRTDLAGPTEDETDLHLRVEDTGIAPQDTEAVFRPLVQRNGSATRRHDGTGLRLAIAWDAVETHGGPIWVESTPGNGSTFHLTVRLRRDPAARHRPPGATPSTRARR